jgi:phospholipid transport system substrate-binding protein
MMARSSSSRITVAVLLAASLWARPSAAAETPLEVIRTSNNQVLGIFAGKAVIDRATEEKAFAVIDKVTDFDRISGTVVDGFCPKLKPEECVEFKRVFTKLLRVSSIKKLGRYRADLFDYKGEEITGRTAVVRTIAHYKKDLVALDYHLENVGGRWIIVDYVVDEVDTIRNYKKQFTRILAKENFRQMIERLERKISEYEGGE